jgi:hypothetical protein
MTYAELIKAQDAAYEETYQCYFQKTEVPAGYREAAFLNYRMWRDLVLNYLEGE